MDINVVSIWSLVGTRQIPHGAGGAGIEPRSGPPRPNGNGPRAGGSGSQGFTYSGSNDLNAVAWYYVNSLNAEQSLYQGRGTWPVSQLAANELGIHDMSGNVWEWCEDLASDPSRRLRGGSWLYNGPFSSVTYRSDESPSTRATDIGFRVARKAVE